MVEGQHHRAPTARIEDSGQTALHPPIQAFGALEKEGLVLSRYTDTPILAVCDVVKISHCHSSNRLVWAREFHRASPYGGRFNYIAMISYPRGRGRNSVIYISFEFCIIYLCNALSVADRAAPGRREKIAPNYQRGCSSALSNLGMKAQLCGFMRERHWTLWSRSVPPRISLSFLC